MPNKPQVIGTICPKDIGNSKAAQGKMFVISEFRGRFHGIAAQLLEMLLNEVRDRKASEIFLGTTEKFEAARRIYEKHGFAQIDEHLPPPPFPKMGVDTSLFDSNL